MKKLLAPLLLILLLATFCQAEDNKDVEIEKLRSKIDQQQSVINRQNEFFNAEMSKIKALTQSVYLSSSQILDHLDALDEKIYKGEFLGKAKAEKADKDEMVSAYLALLEKIEADLQTPAK